MKLAGHDAGEKCVIVDVIDRTYVLIAGPGIKRKRCNVAHLEPLPQKLDIAKGASDEEVKRALEATSSGGKVE